MATSTDRLEELISSTMLFMIFQPGAFLPCTAGSVKKGVIANGMATGEVVGSGSGTEGSFMAAFSVMQAEDNPVQIRTAKVMNEVTFLDCIRNVNGTSFCQFYRISLEKIIAF